MYRLYLSEMLPKVLYPHGNGQPNASVCITQNAMFRTPLYEGTFTLNMLYQLDPFNSTYQVFPAVKGAVLSKVVRHLQENPTGPQWYASNVTLQRDHTYDLVCTDYDCVAIGKVISFVTGSKSTAKPYPGSFTDTLVVKQYIESFHC